MSDGQPPVPGPPISPGAALPAAAQRQRDVFGRAAIDPLLVGLRDRLAAVLTARPEEARSAAHQLAGLAGTLGFAELAEAWERLSQDGDSGDGAAYQIARSALAALRRANLSDGGD